MTDLVFDDEYTARRGNLTVIWEDIGEGMSGEYNPDDPDDVPLLRFAAFQGEEMLENASYCTQMPVGTDPEILRMGLVLVLRAAEGENSKKELEMLSWMKPEDFRGGA